MVGIGASAGGVEALRQLFEHLPPDIGMVFVVIQHLSPSQPSLLRETLARSATMPVVAATHAARVQPGHVYVIPPGVELTIARGQLELRPRDDGARRSLPIDLFFASLAAEMQAGAIGVILSGTASDGTEGFKAIKEQGGITFAQDPASAQFSGMPESAIAAGVVDYRLSPQDIAAELVRLSSHPYVVPAGRVEPTGIDAEDEERYAQILQQVRQVSGTDFTRYKSTTVRRRIARRMALGRVASLQDYAEVVAQTPGEAQALSQDILVHVTSFFRDPEVLESLKAQAFPEILRRKEGASLKLWVPGCATGEEVYTTAIALLEYLDDSHHDATIQIFGSDLSEAAIHAARAGVYSESGVRGVSEERLRRFFTRTDNGYRISKRVRDLCVFVVHDLTRDPPFATLDLISCRNVLIYFSAELQHRLIPLFHFALNQPGYLVLGRSEAISGFHELFAPLDKSQRVFVKTGTSRRGPFLLHSGGRPSHQPEAKVGLPAPTRPAVEAQRQADHLLLARYAPPGVIVNDRLDVVQFRGSTAPFLEQPPGQPQTNVLKIARTGLLRGLRQALQEAQQRDQAVRKEGVRMRRQDGGLMNLTLEVVPLPDLRGIEERHYLLLFEDAPGGPPGPGPRSTPAPSNEVSDHGQELRELKQELLATRQFLQSLIDEHQSTNDDLAGANEELIAGNEELQSTNEELESAKEELQSANEELSTVNDELRSRNQELDLLATDLANVLESAAIPMVIVDAQRNIRRFTPLARGILNVVPSDVGRSIGDLTLNLEVDGFDDRIAKVIETGKAAEWTVQHRAGRWHRIQIRPYYAADGQPNGAVVSLIDIDDLRRATAAAEEANQSKDLFLATLSHELRTPLSVILMGAQILQKVEDETVRRTSTSIERAARLQTNLISDLLDVSRITAGKLTLDMCPTEIATVLRDALDLNREAAEAKSLRLEIAIPDGIGTVNADAARLQQIVSNLLTNAIKFTPCGGCVSLTLERIEQTAKIQVRDTGMGINPDFLPCVFDSFSQADSSRTRALGGLGLGLGIVKLLVEMHRGVVTAESPGVERGATFTVTLPLLAPGRMGATAARGNLVAGQSIAGVRVLVVEDDDATLTALVEMLTQFGASVRGAGSAGEGLKAMSDFQPQVLLSDLAMPGEDGYSLITKVRALTREDGGQVPAAALSALAADQDRQRALAAGFQMHLAKPVEAARLVAAVAALAAARVRA